MVEGERVSTADLIIDNFADRGEDESGGLVPLTKTAQVRMCGNSVSPPLARALVEANCVTEEQREAA